VRSATFDGTADDAGMVTDASVAIYRNLGKGEIGLVVTGFAFVSAPGQVFLGQFGANSDAMILGLRRLVQAVHESGSKIAMQIVHGGINVMKEGVTALAVSRIPQIDKPHREIADAEIEAIINDFTAAARRAREAGFDAVQLHGAHGYLMSQFLSPLMNHRTDRWGGNIENRRRFHLEVIRRIRRTVGADFPMLLKFGAKDELDGGLTLEDGIEAARLMVREGIEAIEVSAGMSSSGPRAANPTRKAGETEWPYFRERAAVVKKAVTVPVIAVGGIRSLAQAQDIVDSGDADLISMCRPFIREPGLLKRWQENDSSAARCISCNRCYQDGITLDCGLERRRRGGKGGSTDTPRRG
jgi:2,4-dienoyl-CoA reductase-like NADH-dependent reductase (Old Yellow Enzyme family)